MMLHRLESPAAALSWLRALPVAGTLRSDSRAVRPGDAFIAWPGHRRDGRGFVASALNAGASACLVELDGVDAFGFDDPRIAAMPGLKAAAGEVASGWFGEPSRQLPVIAVTGTNGKTSTACWIAQSLSALGWPCGVVGTLGAGIPGALVDTGLTTPDPVALQAALAGFVQQGLKASAIEASSIGIVEHRLDGTAIEAAVFTNLTQDHLDYHGSMAAYWAAKRALFDWPGLRAAVVNVDDAAGAELVDALREGTLALWSCSLHPGARLQAKGVSHDQDGLRFDLVEAGAPAPVPVSSALVGEHNVHNLLGVVGALRALGLPLADVARVVGRLTSVPGRLQRVVCDDLAADVSSRLPAVIVDYAHTPDALEKALRALRPLAQARRGRLWCVFGCGGDRDATKRPLMGAIASRDADQVVITSDNPRGESPRQILSQILMGVARSDDVDLIEDRSEAIAHAVAHAAPVDVLLVAGKGHETYQEVAGVKRPFSDVEQAAKCLHQLAAGAHAC